MSFVLTDMDRRHRGQRLAVLEALARGPRTIGELALVTSKPVTVIDALRSAGYVIRCQGSDAHVSYVLEGRRELAAAPEQAEMFAAKTFQPSNQ